MDVPYGGNSLDTTFSIAYATDINVAVGLNLASQYLGIKLSTALLNFTEGINSLSFRIVYDSSVIIGSEVTKGSVIFSLTGIDSTIFYLS